VPQFTEVLASFRRELLSQVFAVASFAVASFGVASFCNRTFYLQIFCCEFAQFSMSYQVIARKWRPQTFGDLVGQGHVTETLQNAIRNNRVAHA